MAASLPADAMAAFEQAVALRDRLPYTEPPFRYYPARQSPGHALLTTGYAERAEDVYRSDLHDYARNGGSLIG